MNADDRNQFTTLRAEVGRDIQLAIANFKIWLLVTVLSNVVLIGLPALFVFFNTQSTTETALSIALENQRAIKAIAENDPKTQMRLTAIERHLADRDGYVAPQ